MPAHLARTLVRLPSSANRAPDRAKATLAINHLSSSPEHHFTEVAAEAPRGCRVGQLPLGRMQLANDVLGAGRSFSVYAARSRSTARWA